MSGLHPRPERVAPFHHVIAITTITTGQWSGQLAAGGVIVVITGGAARCPVMNIITPWGDILTNITAAFGPSPPITIIECSVAGSNSG